ncbi:MAG: hypothetical protein ACJ75H_03475 [Thermoanaerobaculia bacterium]
MIAADALLRLLGAEPHTFRTLYGVHKKLLSRGARIVQSRRRGLLTGSSPFATLCFYAALYGFFFLLMMTISDAPLLSAAVVLTVGASFLVLVVVTDHFDLLVNPREMLVLAAHPHDDRSFLLAKLAAIGRVLALLSLLLFGLPAVVAGFAWHSWLAPLAFLAGAAGVSLAAALFALLLGLFLVRMGGRSAIDRIMPWLQGAFQIGYLFVVGGERLVGLTTAKTVPSKVLWAVPSFWFASPLELLQGGPTAAALGRLGLAASLVALLLFGATRWLSAGLTERLLEPVASRRTTRHRPLRTGASEPSRLFAILRVHLRSDWRTRSEFLLIPLMGCFFLLFYLRGRADGPPPRGFTVFIYSWFLVLAGDVLTRSTRPASLWWILTSPIDRTRFSMATVSLVRAFQLAPLFAASAIAEVRQGGFGPDRLALIAEMLALGDFLVLAGKALFPDFPFSQPRSEGAGGGHRMALMLVGGLVSGGAALAVWASGLFGVRGLLAGAAAFFLLRFPLERWARRRAAVAAASLEMSVTVG